MICHEGIKIEDDTMQLGWAKYVRYQNGFILDLLRFI